MEPSSSVPEGDLLAVRVERNNSSLLLRASGEMDLASAGVLEEELNSGLSSDASMVVLDLGDVDFIDSAGVRVLVEGARRSRQNGNRLSIWLGSAIAVRRLIEVCGVERELPLTG